MSRLIKFIKSIINIIRNYRIHKSSSTYIEHLRSKGIRIGEGCCVFSPKNILIDTTRPELIEIGNNVFLHKGITILTHDWCGWCFVNTHKTFIPSHGKVKIGNNVWFGQNVTVCKGVTIGNNCIIGIGSIVTKSIPDNSVAAGIPARVICTYNEYIEKREKAYIAETIEYANAIIDSGREPNVADFYDDYPAFVDESNYKEYDYPYHKVFKNSEDFEVWKRNHVAPFKGYDEFIKYVKDNRK